MDGGRVFGARADHRGRQHTRRLHCLVHRAHDCGDSITFLGSTRGHTQRYWQRVGEQGMDARVSDEHRTVWCAAKPCLEFLYLPATSTAYPSWLVRPPDRAGSEGCSGSPDRSRAASSKSWCASISYYSFSMTTISNSIAPVRGGGL
eukprot:4080375-Prymnesium_polylepis.1